MDHLDRSQAHGEALEQQMNVLRVAPHTVERSLRWWRGIACMGLLVTLAMMVHPPSAPALIEVRSGPGLRYEVMAEVPSGGSYEVVAQEQEWYKIQLPDGREGWVHRFYMGQPPSQTAPVVTPPPAMPSSAVATPAVTPSLVVPTQKTINSAPPAAPEKFKLIVRAVPVDSIVKLKNTKTDYRPGLELPAGRYDLVVTREGYKPVQRTVTISNADVTLDVTLEPEKKYRLTVQVMPADSIVKLDKSKLDYRPGLELVPGRYRLWVTRKGYKSALQQVVVIDGDVMFSITLEPEQTAP